jgi:glycosyltransferase involved in cell wall biosynthesis
MISIVVPAHNEGSVISRTLSTWFGSSRCDELNVTVVCNGCTDETANLARAFGSLVQVIESDVASKTHALNLGDQSSRVFPRIYVDADVVLTIDAIRALAQRLERGDVLAVAPTPEINLTGCSWLVRKYFGMRSRLPSSREGIGGSGVYALSETGRRRFPQFPDVLADDMYVRLQFKPDERETLSSVKSIVFAPRTIQQLISVRTRIYLGMFELADRFPELWMNRDEDNSRTLLRSIKEPRVWSELAVYCYVNVLARWRARTSRRAGTFTWQRDITSRVAVSADSSE